MDHYLIAGNPVEHSQSPHIHAEFAKLTGEPVAYGRKLVPLDAFAATIRELAASGVKGCNVTVPFKFEAYRLLDRPSERARLAQACNAMRFDAEGGISGDNTDGIGLVRDIESNAGVALAGRRVLLVGAGGGAAGALGPLLAARPAEVVVANRTLANAEALVGAHREAIAAGTALRASTLQEAGVGYAVIVNASSSSLQAAGSPIAPAAIAPGALVLDMMYGPAARPFLDWAERHGGRGRDGLGMLVEQAAAAFEFWRGIRPPTAGVLAALQARLRAA